MMHARPWELRYDLASTHVLLWVANAGRSGTPTPDVHLFLYDRYWRLAEYHAEKGHRRRAAALRERAVQHYRLSGHDGPPFAAALALGRPRTLSFTEARGPNDAA